MISRRPLLELAAILPLIPSCVPRGYHSDSEIQGREDGPQSIETIYLHWTATEYDWVVPYHYHTVVTGDGTVHRLTPYRTKLTEHTRYRNTNGVGIATACMGGDDPWSTPCTSAQVEAMCKEVADLLFKEGWPLGKIDIKSVMTHAEAASNLDGRTTPENYGPVAWGGSGQRWDFLMVAKGEQQGSGGDILRGKIKRYLAELQDGGNAAPVPVYEEAKVIVNDTWLKRRPIPRVEQSASEVCRIEMLHSVGISSRTLEGSHYKVKIDIPTSACPGFTGDAYLFKDHFVIAPRFDSSARPGMARSRKPTFLKARPEPSSTLPDDAKCFIPGNRVLTYLRRESEGIHHKVKIDIAPGGCERFAGTEAYIYPLDFSYEPRRVHGSLVAIRDGAWLRREPGDVTALPDTKKCRVTISNVATYYDMITEGPDSRLLLSSGGPECPDFRGPVYVANGEFQFHGRPEPETMETIRATQDTHAKIDVRGSQELAEGTERCAIAAGESVTFVQKRDLGDYFVVNTGSHPQKCAWMNNNRSVFLYKRHFGFSEGGED